jgi:hypothetical protein
MGRGLSPLQQQILRLAWAREQPTPPRHEDYTVLYSHEILVRVYGWTVTHGRGEWWRERGLAPAQAWHFQPGQIGQARYRAGIVAVSRSLRRLRDRGLLEQMHGGGWRLTDQGRAAVQAVMVDYVVQPPIKRVKRISH